MTELERIERISRLAERFRMAASLPEIRGNFAGYHSFPHASCTWTSFAVGLLLLELEPEHDWHLVNGRKPSVLEGHDWLEDGRFAVDVTADQFLGEQSFVGLAPSPLARQWPLQRRIELSNATELQLKGWLRYELSCSTPARKATGVNASEPMSGQVTRISIRTQGKMSGESLRKASLMRFACSPVSILTPVRS